MPFAVFRRWSIQRKLLASMLLCLVLFIAISVAAGVVLTQRALEKRVVGEELPAILDGVRADIQRQIAEPLTASIDLADNHFLLRWEAAGQPEDGAEGFKAYAARLKAKHKAAAVYWVSEANRHYWAETGVQRTLGPDEGWFAAFLASGKPYSVDMDKDKSSNEFMLFINARVDAGPGHTGLAGLGLSVNALAQQIQQYRIGETGSVMLVRANGTVIVHRDAAVAADKRALADLPGFGPEAAAALIRDQQKFSHLLHDSHEGELVLASSYVPELNAYVVASVPKAELLAEVTRVAWTAPLFAGVVGGGLAMVLIVWVSGAIAAPVRRAAALLGEIASGDGDLSRRMQVDTEDEIGQLAEAFNRFVDVLQQMVRQVRASSESIATATAEVATGNLDLSNRTEQASSSLQETAAAMSQLTEQVQHNAASTREANALARSAQDVATRGGAAMAEVERTMGGIDESSRRIGDIIGVIDGIAFQTNILALNAAVEAARAGEQGRGFAVVAGEVRSLAQRSAQAAKEVRGLIHASMEQAQGGRDQVRGAGDTMRELLESVSRVAHLIDGISGGTQHQSQGIGEVNTAVLQLDSMTQQNAALVEEGSAAAESLREQAATLAAAVGRFKLA